MKGDFTRDTFKPEKHYSSVRMQQGRVQLDADWNEQQDINFHRIESETVDSIGLSGTPINDAGFEITASGNNLKIGAGRYYVNGILCENESDNVYIDSQPDIPASNQSKLVVLSNDLSISSLPPPDGKYVVFLDVWRRHISALEDTYIRETALGGPDTATRLKTIWQVKLLKPKDDFNCNSDLSEWENLTAKPTGSISARAKLDETKEKPCVIEPGSGYRRLENQLYRVEIHKSGKDGEATFKWSRDNGSIEVSWLDPSQGNNLNVSSLGRDKYLGLESSQYVELFDDSNELYNKPGVFVKIVNASDNIIEIDPLGQTIAKANFPDNPRIRRWESDGDIKIETNHWIDLEDGVEIKFTAGTYNTGDYWLIPARTATGDVEWEKDSIGNPVQKAPNGVMHSFCRLAVAECEAGTWTVLNDCRKLFPPLTEMVNLYYVSGDGQEAMPNNMLPEKLRVRASNGGIPVENSKIKYHVSRGGGLLSTDGGVTFSSVLTINTNQQGIAECEWKPGSKGPQEVTAQLLDGDGHELEDKIIYFNANLSIASNVLYEPQCKYLIENLEEKTVQAAIDALCMREQNNCFNFLDELRADGIVPGKNGKMGFDVSPGDGLYIYYTDGIAYVGGCRFEIPAGKVQVDPSTTHQTLLVNAVGQVELITKGNLPDKCAVIAIITTFKEEIKRIIDARFNLYHLDNKAEQNFQRTTEKRIDRRQFVPLLAQSINGLEFKDGRNMDYPIVNMPLFNKGLPYGLASDGENIWSCNFSGPVVAKIPRQLKHIDDIEYVILSNNEKATSYGAAYDGDSLWFTLFNLKSVICLEPKSMRRREIKVGTFPTGIAFDGDFIWVCNTNDKNVSVIDVETCQIVRTVDLKGMPWHAAFDGVNMWIAAEPNLLYKIEKPWGKPIEIDDITFNRGYLTFDGTHMWISSRNGPLQKVDVTTNKIEHVLVNDIPSTHAITFDGTYIWALARAGGNIKENTLYKIDPQNNQPLFWHTTFENNPCHAIFDGSHLWISHFEGISKKLI